MICHCDVEAKNAKTGKVFCSKTEVGCDPPKDSKDSGGEFPIFQNLFLCVLFFVQNIFQANQQLDDPFSRDGKKCKKGQHWEAPAGKSLRKKTFPH